MDREKEKQFMKKFTDYAAGFYYDCTRNGLYEMVCNICNYTIENKEYNKFVEATAMILFNKIYIEGEVWKPELILGLIDIMIEALGIQETKTNFLPANAMVGDQVLESKNLKDRIIVEFNKRIKEFNEPEMLPLQ